MSSKFSHCSLKPSQVNMMIYHHPCSDGMTSAVCLYEYRKCNNRRYDDIIFIGANYNNQEDTIMMADLIDTARGKYLLVCDFSYSENITQALINVSAGFLVLDHHVSAMKNLININDNYKVFDMNRSGAYLAWEYFFQNKNDETINISMSIDTFYSSQIIPKIPLLIEYVQDRDLFTNTMHMTNEFVAWFYNLPIKMKIYNEYFNNDNKLLQMIETTGTHYCEITDIYIDNLCWCNPIYCEIDKIGYFVGIVNSKLFKSDIGNRLLYKYKWLDFSIVYNTTEQLDEFEEKTYISLRSHNEATDVSEIAKKVNGGGHRNAAGVVLNKYEKRVLTCIDPKSIIRNIWNDYINIINTIQFVVDDGIRILYFNYNCDDNSRDILMKYLLDDKNIYINKIEIFCQRAQYLDYKINNLSEIPKYRYDVCVAVNIYCDVGTIFYVKYDKKTSDDIETNFNKKYNIVKGITIKLVCCNKL